MRKTIVTEELADRLHSAALRLLRLVRVEDARTGIAPARLSALAVIVFGGPLSLGELARAEQVKPPTMSRIVDALEEEGYARRQIDAKDRRAVQIVATPKGMAVLQRGRKRRVKLLASYLSRLGHGEQRAIARALEAIQRALEKR